MSARMKLRAAVSGALIFIYAIFCMPALPAAAASERLAPPTLAAAQNGLLIERVTIETYGVTTPAIVRQYLSLQEGQRVTQRGLDRDFANMVRLGGFRPRGEILAGTQPGSVVVHWIVMNKWLRPTSHPFYSDTPLSAPIQGVGFILTAPPVNKQGGNISAYTQLSKRANLARLLYTQPLHTDPASGNQSSLIADAFGGRGVFRASEPKAINVFSWSTGEELLYLFSRTTGTQFEGGVRETRTSDELSSNLVATSLYNTSEHPGRNLQVLAAISHACLVPAYQWRPPTCSLQYRFGITDAIGGFASTTRYQVYSADTVKYFDAGPSTIALHASAVRSGGVLPDSFLLCSYVRAYPKPFCGTDSQVATLEYRINESKHPKLEFILFTEDAASRVRGAETNVLPYFTWHPDSGVGVVFHGFRLDVARGQAGDRLTYELQGQLY
jgi:hypothetical protein